MMKTQSDTALSPDRANVAEHHSDHEGGVRRRAIDVAERLMLPIVLVAVVILFASISATNGVFLTGTNIRNVLGGEAVVGILALAVMVPIIANQYDISSGAIVGFTCMLVAGLTTRSGLSPVLAVLVAIGVGTLIGAINGFLIAYLNVSSIIATIGMSVVIQGIVSLYSRDETISDGIPQGLVDAVSGTWLGVPKTFVLLLVVALAVYVVLQHTTYGRYVHALGSSENASRLIGLRTQWLTMTTMMVSGMLAGLAGVILLGYSGTASPAVGPSFTLPALSAVFLGSTTLFPGRFNVPGTIISIYLVAVIINGLTLSGATDWVEPFFNGMALLVAVSLASLVSGKARLPAFMRRRRR